MFGSFQEDQEVWLIYPDGRKVQTVVTKRHPTGPMYVAGYPWPFETNSGKCRKRSERTRVEPVTETIETYTQLDKHKERELEVELKNDMEANSAKFKRVESARQVARAILGIHDYELSLTILEAVKKYIYPEGE